MSEQLIISVSREYGSGGHEIAQKLAEYYKLPMYDHNLLDEVAASMNVSSKELAEFDEKRRNKFLYRSVMAGCGGDCGISEELHRCENCS